MTFLRNLVTAAFIAGTILCAVLEFWASFGLFLFGSVCALAWHLKGDHNG